VFCESRNVEHGDSRPAHNPFGLVNTAVGLKERASPEFYGAPTLFALRRKPTFTAWVRKVLRPWSYEYRRGSPSIPPLPRSRLSEHTQAGLAPADRSPGRKWKRDSRLRPSRGRRPVPNKFGTTLDNHTARAGVTMPGCPWCPRHLPLTLLFASTISFTSTR
jgi:hypothetical protein